MSHGRTEQERIHLRQCIEGKSFTTLSVQDRLSLLMFALWWHNLVSTERSEFIRTVVGELGFTQFPAIRVTNTIRQLFQKE